MAIEKFDPLSGVGDLKTIDLQTNDRGVVEPLNNPRWNLGKSVKQNAENNPE